MSAFYFVDIQWDKIEIIAEKNKNQGVFVKKIKLRFKSVYLCANYNGFFVYIGKPIYQNL